MFGFVFIHEYQSSFFQPINLSGVLLCFLYYQGVPNQSMNSACLVSIQIVSINMVCIVHKVTRGMVHIIMVSWYRFIPLVCFVRLDERGVPNPAGVPDGGERGGHLRGIGEGPDTLLRRTGKCLCPFHKIK